MYERLWWVMGFKFWNLTRVSIYHASDVQFCTHPARAVEHCKARFSIPPLTGGAGTGLRVFSKREFGVLFDYSTTQFRRSYKGCAFRSISVVGFCVRFVPKISCIHHHSRLIAKSNIGRKVLKCREWLVTPAKETSIIFHSLKIAGIGHRLLELQKNSKVSSDLPNMLRH